MQHKRTELDEIFSRIVEEALDDSNEDWRGPQSMPQLAVPRHDGFGVILTPLEKDHEQ